MVSIPNFALISGESPWISLTRPSTFPCASDVSAPTDVCNSTLFCALWNCCSKDNALPSSPSTCEVSTFITAGASSICFCVTQYWITAFASSTCEESTSKVSL